MGKDIHVESMDAEVTAAIRKGQQNDTERMETEHVCGTKPRIIVLGCCETQSAKKFE